MISYTRVEIRFLTRHQVPSNEKLIPKVDNNIQLPSDILQATNDTCLEFMRVGLS